MATPVLMPQMGESITEGTIVRWIKKVGDVVDRDRRRGRAVHEEVDLPDRVGPRREGIPEADAGQNE